MDYLTVPAAPKTREAYQAWTNLAGAQKLWSIFSAQTFIHNMDGQVDDFIANVERPYLMRINSPMTVQEIRVKLHAAGFLGSDGRPAKLYRVAEER